MQHPAKRSARRPAVARQLIEQLQGEIHRVQGRRRTDADERSHPIRFSTGVAALDRMLPEGGLRRGTLIEWIGEGGGTLLALLAARQSLAIQPAEVQPAEVQPTGRLAIVQCGASALRLYPPAVAAWGLPLDSIAWLQTENRADQWWAFDQGLRSPAVTAIVTWLDVARNCPSEAGPSAGGPSAARLAPSCTPLGLAGERMYRRWQLAAEASGAVGLLVRCAAARDEPSWADVRWLVHACTLNDSWTNATPQYRFDVECLRTYGAPTVRRIVCETPAH